MPPNAKKHVISTVAGGGLAAQFNSLVGDGPLEVHPENLLATLGKGWLEPPAGGKVSVSAHDLGQVTMDSMIADPDMRNVTVFGTAKLVWVSTFLQNLDEAGIEWKQFDKLEDTRDYVTKEALERLTEAQRTINISQWWSDDCATASWPDYVKVKNLLDMDNGFKLLRQFRGFMCGGYTQADRDSQDFKDRVEVVTASVYGRDITKLVPVSQAAHVVKWAKLTAPPDGALDACITYEDESESMRRGNESDSARFKGLFLKNWRKAYKELSTALPNSITASMAWTYTEAMTGPCGIALPLVHGSVVAICLNLVATLAAVDSDLLKSKSNETRLAALMNGLGSHSSRPGGASAGGLGTSNSSNEQLQEMYGNSSYVDLSKKLEVLAAVLPLDTAAVLNLLKTHDHPAGDLFLNGRNPGQSVWKALTNVLNEEVWNTTFNAAMSVDKEGEDHLDWLLAFDKGVPRKMLTYQFALGDGKSATNIHLFRQVLMPILTESHGAHVANKLARFASATNEEFFLDSHALRTTASIAARVFAFAGFTGKGVTSFRSFWQGFTDRAQTLEDMPKEILIVKDMRVRLGKTAVLVFEGAAKEGRTNITRPWGQLAKPTDWLVPGTLAYSAVLKYDELEKELLGDLNKARHGLGRIPGLPGASQLVTTYLGGGATSETWKEEKEHKTAAKLFEYPTGLSADWGGAATRHGIFYDDGSNGNASGICFGRVLVSFGKEFEFDIEKQCLAKLAPAKHSSTRSKWCNHSRCTSHADHERPAGLTEDDLHCKEITSAEREKMQVIVDATEPFADFAPKKAKGEGKGEGKGSGKGSDQSKGKGKGKGKAKGKSGGRGIGKTQLFPRQR